MAVARAHGAATIINAMACGRGAAFGIDLHIEAEATLGGSGIEAKIQGERGDTKLIEACAKNTLAYINMETGAKVETRGNIPIARGLKSSSVAANAVILALLKEAGKKISDEEFLRLAVKSAKDAGVTITGALDDAAASYYGGVVVTDNDKGEIVFREDFPELDVVIYYPNKKSYSAKVDMERIREIKDEVSLAWRLAKNRQYYTAMVVNSLLYCKVLGIDPQPAYSAIKSGALAAGLSGKGPAFVALCDDEFADAVADEWKNLEGTVLRAKTTNRRSE